MRALRRHMSGDIDNFPRDVAELVDWFDARDPNPHVRPVPGYGEKIPVWLLGSSLYSAQLAAQLGSAVRVRLPLRAGYAASGAASLSYALQTV